MRRVGTRSVSCLGKPRRCSLSVSLVGTRRHHRDVRHRVSHWTTGFAGLSAHLCRRFLGRFPRINLSGRLAPVSQGGRDFYFVTGLEADRLYQRLYRILKQGGWLDRIPAIPGVWQGSTGDSIVVRTDCNTSSGTSYAKAVERDEICGLSRSFGRPGWGRSGECRTAMR